MLKQLWLTLAESITAITYSIVTQPSNKLRHAATGPSMRLPQTAPSRL